jgi:excisionase family DNA binding protein
VATHSHISRPQTQRKPDSGRATYGAMGLSITPDRREGVCQLSVRPREAALMLGISVSSLERLTKAGEIPRLKNGNTVLYRVASLDAWLARREACNSDEVP